jgi:sec-independent protein translocase protein TatC
MLSTLPEKDLNAPLIPSKHQSFWSHLGELRSLLIQSFCLWLLACMVAAFCFPFLAKGMNWPLFQAAKKNPELLQGLVTNSPMGVFSVLFQICFFGGTGLSLPFILILWARFLGPALSMREKKLLLPLAMGAFVLFFVGACFSYFWVVPASLSFSMELNKLFGFKLIWSAADYYRLVCWMSLGIGLCFEFPLVVLGLLAGGLVSVAKFKSIRGYMLLGILIVGAAIIPGGDPLSLILLAGPLYGSYELVLFVGNRLEKRKNNTCP